MLKILNVQITTYLVFIKTLISEITKTDVEVKAGSIKDTAQQSASISM